MTTALRRRPARPELEHGADAAPFRPKSAHHRGVRSGRSVTFRLVVLVILVLAPAAVMVAWIARSWESASEQDAAAAASRFAEAAAVHQENLVGSTHVVLEVLALTPAIADRGACASTLTEIARQRPEYAVMGVADAGGSLWCSSTPTEGPVTVSDRDYFIAARETGTTAVGRYQIDRVTGKPTVAVAHPLFDADGSFSGAVIASLDLSRPAALAERLSLPDASTVTVLDDQGTVLMRWPVADGYLGTVASGEYRSLRSGETSTMRGMDGVERVYGAAALGSDGSSLTLMVGVPLAAVESAAASSLREAIGWFALIAVAAGVAAIMFGRRRVVAPIQNLQAATRRLADGDLSERASFEGGGELSELAADFDEMAVALQERQHELRLAERRAVEERYRGLLDVAADAIVVADGTGRVVLFNVGAEQMFGCTPEEAVGRAVSEVLGAEITPNRPVLLTWSGGDGEDRWADAHASVGSDGLITVIVRDATDQHRAIAAEAAVRERDARFRLAQEHSAIGLALVGLDGRWLDVNPALCRILGRSESDLLRLTFQAITHPDDLDADLGQVQRLLAGEIDGYSMEKRYFRGDGHVVWAQLHGTVVRDDAGEPLYFVAQVQDITATKEMLAELERQHAELQRSNAELEQFAYVASHDLSEPLRSIRGFAELLEADLAGELSGESAEYLGFLTDAAGRMQSLINDLLAFSRVSRSALEAVAVDLDAVLADVLDVFGPTIVESGATVECRPLPVVQGNRSLLTQLLQNLVGNALKFRQPDAAPVVLVRSTHVEDGLVELVVEDNGIGIGPEYRERVFRMFQRLHTRTAYEGTGMGLAISAKIVESLGGRIWIDDSTLGGTAVHLTLPTLEEQR